MLHSNHERDSVQMRSHNPAIFGATGTFAEPDFFSESEYGPLDDADRAHDLLELVDPAEPAAANDDRYAMLSAPVELQDSVTTGLIRGLLWWAFFVCIGFAAFAIVLR